AAAASAVLASNVPATSSESAPSHRRTNPGWHNPFDAPAAPAPTSNGLAAPSSIFSEPPAAHGPSMGPSSFAPVTSSFAPSAGSFSHSTGPVALNVDEDSPPVARGRRFRPERWLLAAAGVIAVGVIAFNNSDLFSGSKSVAAAEKQASAAALVAHPYEAPAEKPSAKSAEPADEKDDGKDAPIGSLKGEAGEEDSSDAPSAAAAEPVAKPSSAKEKDSTSSKEALHEGFARAFSKAPGKESKRAEKPAKASRSRASKASHGKAPSRASASSKSKKAGGPKTGSAFDPLNGSLP
ncbi:MAG TPA: hypothetical protein VFS67_29155, partial [Polyangiaceae bacterium]|nr:hypothetical protein [Polyangiaceae bacterium]